MLSILWSKDHNVQLHKPTSLYVCTQWLPFSQLIFPRDGATGAHSSKSNMQAWHHLGWMLKHKGSTKKCKSEHEQTVFYVSLLQKWKTTVLLIFFSPKQVSESMNPICIRKHMILFSFPVRRSMLHYTIPLQPSLPLIRRRYTRLSWWAVQLSVKCVTFSPQLLPDCSIYF